MTARALASFVGLAQRVGQAEAEGADFEFGRVQPVVPKGEDEEKINVFYARIGGSVITALKRRRVAEVELQWTVVGSVWQDCNTVNDAIIEALFEARAVAADAGVSTPEDEAFPADGMTPMFAITTSATLRDADW